MRGRPLLSARVLAALVGVILMSSVPTVWCQSYDLTGYWESDGGVRYQFRQVGNRLFWHVDNLPRVTNVFVGTIAGEMITGRWADLPGGQMTGDGTLGLRIESNDYIVKVSQSGPYGGTYWRRVGTAQPPPPPPPDPTTNPQTSKPDFCSTLAGCSKFYWRQGSGNYSVFRTKKECRYEMMVDGSGYRKSGAISFQPDPDDPENKKKTIFRMEDTQATDNVLCTLTGKIFGDEVQQAEIACDNGWSSGFSRSKQEAKICGDMGLKSDASADMVPLYDAVPGLGSWWMVYGTDKWVAIWTRRGESDVFDGEWTRGGTSVRTVVRMVRTGNQVTITREQSTDGHRCTFDGQIRGVEVTGSARCAAAGRDFGAPWEFRATIHP